MKCYRCGGYASRNIAGKPICTACMQWIAINNRIDTIESRQAKTDALVDEIVRTVGNNVELAQRVVDMLKSA